MHPLPKALGPTFPLVSALTSTRPSARNTAGGSDLPASWRLILTLGRSPEGPSKGLGAPTLGIGNLRTPALDSPCSPPPPGPLGAPPVIQARERVGPSEPLASFEGRQRQNTWAHAPTHQRPPLGPPPPPRHTAHGSCLPASSGLILTLGRPPRGSSQGAWHRNARDWGPPPQRWTHPPPHRHPGLYWRRWSFRAGECAGHTEPLAHFEGPRAKLLGPRSHSSTPSARPAPPLAAHPADRACRPPGG